MGRIKEEQSRFERTLYTNGRIRRIPVSRSPSVSSLPKHEVQKNTKSAVETFVFKQEVKLTSPLFGEIDTKRHGHSSLCVFRAVFFFFWGGGGFAHLDGRLGWFLFENEDDFGLRAWCTGRKCLDT